MTRRQRGEGALFKRASDGLWVGRVELGWIDGKRRRKTVYGRTLAECLGRLNNAKAAVAAGNIQTASTSLRLWLDLWLTEVCPTKQKMRPRTLANYESYARNYLVPALGGVRLDQLAARHIRELHRFILNKGLSATTAGHAHTILSTSLNDAIREGLITRNPCELVDRPPSTPNVRRALGLGEVRRVLEVIDGDLLATRWLTALLLGMRQGECLGLRWDRVDLDRGVITVDTQLQRIPYVKGTKELRTLPGYEYTVVKGNLCLVTTKTESSKRLVPIPDVLAAGLEQHECDTAAVGGAAYTHGLVWTDDGGSPIEPTDDRLAWHQILTDAHVEDTDLHSARHTTSTLLLALGIDQQVRMAILGQSVAATNERYTHVDLALTRAAIDALQSAVDDSTRLELPAGARMET